MEKTEEGLLTGRGLIMFEVESSAVTALTATDGTEIDGHHIHVSFPPEHPSYHKTNKVRQLAFLSHLSSLFLCERMRVRYFYTEILHCASKIWGKKIKKERKLECKEPPPYAQLIEFPSSPPSLFLSFFCRHRSRNLHTSQCCSTRRRG